MKRYLNLIILVLLFVSPLSGQSNSQQTAQQEKRIALVIGNGNYIGSVLANPENDARSMTDVLRKLGFTVYPYENLNASQMKRAIDNFGAKLKGNDVGLFYYAGHGIQAKGYNYLIPVDANLQTEEQVEYDCVRADRVLALMETSGTKVNVIILDACRNNPFERSWTRSATGRGLAFMSAPRGTLIAYATAPGSTASDGSGKNGLYTSAILESIQISEYTIIQMFQNVRNIVAQKSKNQQMPWESTSLTGDFYFKYVFGQNISEINSIITKDTVDKAKNKSELVVPKTNLNEMPKSNINETITGRNDVKTSSDKLLSTDINKLHNPNIEVVNDKVNNILYFGDTKLFASIDGGKSWNKISPLFMTIYDRLASIPDTITYIEPNTKIIGEIAVGTQKGYVHFTKDNGKTWMMLYMTSVIIRKIIFSSFVPSVFYILSYDTTYETEDKYTIYRFSFNKSYPIDASFSVYLSKGAKIPDLMVDYNVDKLNLITQKNKYSFDFTRIPKSKASLTLK